jgi:hypothetical protein
LRYFIVFIFASLAHAVTPGEGTVDVGAMIGTSGAVDAQYWFSKQDAVDLGIEFLDRPWTVVFANYTFHFRQLFSQKSKFWSVATPYVGAGGGVGFWDRKDTCGRWNCHWNADSTGSGDGFFLRAVAGLEWAPKKHRYSVFAEVAPSFLWYPDNGHTLDVHVGGRYYF